jgi:hypothetical protein
MKKMLLIALRLCLTVVVLVIAGCESKPNLDIIEKNKDQIISETDHFQYETYEKSTNCDDAFLRFQAFNGTDTLLKFYGGTEVTLTVSKSLTNGQVVFVLIDPYDQMTLLNETTTLHANQGQYRIKVIGEHATGMVSIQVQVSQQNPLSLFE